MGVKPTAEGPAISHDDPGQAKLARVGPPQNLTTHSRAAHPANACRSGAPARVAPDFCSGRPRMRASLGSPTSRAKEHEH